MICMIPDKPFCTYQTRHWILGLLNIALPFCMSCVLSSVLFSDLAVFVWYELICWGSTTGHYTGELSKMQFHSWRNLCREAATRRGGRHPPSLCHCLFILLCIFFRNGSAASTTLSQGAHLHCLRSVCKHFLYSLPAVSWFAIAFCSSPLQRRVAASDLRSCDLWIFDTSCWNSQTNCCRK